MLFEAGPIDRISLPKNNNGRPKPFAFITYEHECSAPYAVALFHNTSLFGRKLSLNSRNKDIKMPKILKNQINADRQDNREPTSWKELKSAKTNDNYNAHSHSHNIPHQLPPQTYPVNDFEALLQMGQQMMFPGIGSASPVGGFPCMPGPMYVHPSVPPVINNFNHERDKMDYPSQMQGGHFGGLHNSYEQSVRENHRSDDRDSHHYNERDNHRPSERDNRHHYERDRKSRNNTRPYDLADHRNRDRKYSSSHMLGHRERR